MEDLSTKISVKIFSDDMHYRNIRDIWIYTSKRKTKQSETRKEKEDQGTEYIVKWDEDTGSEGHCHLHSGCGSSHWLIGFIASLVRFTVRARLPSTKEASNATILFGNSVGRTSVSWTDISTHLQYVLANNE